MTNYLATATKKTTVAKAKREAARQPVAGLEYYTAFVEVSKAIGALVEADKAAVKGGLEKQFIEAGCKAGKTPENFHGIEGVATASVQLRRKTIKSPLTDDEVRELNAHDIPTKHIAATFQIAEHYMDDMVILEKLNKALAKAGLPTDLFEQNTEERHVVTDETVDAIFKKGHNLATKLIPLVAIVAIRPEWNGEFSDALGLTLGELQVEAPAIKTVNIAAPKVQHLPAATKSVAAAKAKPVQTAITTVAAAKPVQTAITTVAAAKPVKAAKLQPFGALTKAQEKKAVTEGWRADKVKGNRSATFAKGAWVWANQPDGAYVAQIVACGGSTAKVHWIDQAGTAVIDLDQMIAVKVPVAETVAA